MAALRNSNDNIVRLCGRSSLKSWFSQRKLNWDESKRSQPGPVIADVKTITFRPNIKEDSINRRNWITLSGACISHTIWTIFSAELHCRCVKPERRDHLPSDDEALEAFWKNYEPNSELCTEMSWEELESITNNYMCSILVLVNCRCGTGVTLFGSCRRGRCFEETELEVWVCKGNYQTCEWWGINWKIEGGVYLLKWCLSVELTKRSLLR